MTIRKLTLLLFLLCCHTSLSAWTFQSVLGPQSLEIGPEFYHSKRTRSGGTEQSGGFYGVYGKYERVKPWGLYWGAEGYWSYGKLEGKSASGNKLCSKMQEYEIEGMLGWTVRFPICSKTIYITPLGGYGNYWGKNDFSKPVFLPITFRDSVEYVSFGFQSKICLSEHLSIGANFRAKWMLEGINRVTNNPFEDDAKLIMGNRMLYNVEFPLEYSFCWHDRPLDAYLTPFYRYREYGSRENFPSDFFETKFNIFGLRLALALRL